MFLFVVTFCVDIWHAMRPLMLGPYFLLVGQESRHLVVLDGQTRTLKPSSLGLLAFFTQRTLFIFP